MLEENNLPTQEEVLMDEDQLLKGLLEAANFKNEEESYRKIEIRRNGKLLFNFQVRPIEETEIQACRKQATRYGKNPMGKHLPKVELDIDYVQLRSLKIYTATVNKEKVWDNPKLKKQLDAITATDIIDKVLMAGEKDKICDVIDEISGYGEDEVTLEEYAKNS